MKIRITYPVFIIAILGSIGMVAFPPFQVYQYFPRATYAVFQGYYGLFYTPEIQELKLRNPSYPYLLKVDLIRLLLQMVAWWLLMLLLSVRRK